ncbi:flap endonuclease GEN homolog 1 isoform X1 [Nothobranchius furzeri]|uniref:flap endonuclease GEN homolog 1 isoform X1 n=1 Tax=Nothobranchius furzeri TaxID=105023 RepID=UPI00390473BF
MGVNDLWSVLEPVRESVPLYSLSGKTLAVDLSLWVCEAQHVQAMMGRVTKPHLRNLFFRVSSLTLMGVKLVFVMEGEAPKLKSETMSKRTEKRHRGFKKGSAFKCGKSTSRGRFNAVLRECAEMLDYLGVAWVTAAGEAEAMCAHLDSMGLVDGCITNDGDAFLYGARTIYRNFNMNSKDPQVDRYQASRVQADLRLSRENLVGLGILLGCDYIPKGVPGVGKEQALKLIEKLKGESLLERFHQWGMATTDVPDVVKKVPHCNICQHPGSAKAHERSGCSLCGSRCFCQPQDFGYQCPCEWHHYEQARQASSLEANIRRKTLACEQFPFTEIIREFLISKEKPVSHFRSKHPNLLSMQKFAYDKMEWPMHYTSEKVLALMTYAELMSRKCGRDVESQIRPIRIFKLRVRNAVACFEVIWSTPEHFVFPEERAAEDRQEVRTLEEESLFRLAFPEIVEGYVKSKALAEESKKKKPKTKKEKPSEVSSDVLDLLGQLSLHSSSSSQLRTLIPPTLNAERAELIVLDTPVNHKQLQKEEDDHTSRFDSGASPAISAVIDALHLSDVDWDSLSFTSSPTSQANLAAESRQTSGEVREQVEPRSAAELCYMECPLRDRLLMKNTAKALNRDVFSKHLSYELKSPENVPRGKDSREISGAFVTNKHQSCSLKEQQNPPLQPLNNTKEKSNVSGKSPQKYKFVRKVLSSSSAAPQSTKKSVCTSACSRSDDSDEENQQRRTKTNKLKSDFLSDIPLKTVSNRVATANPRPSHKLQMIKPAQHNDSAENKRQDQCPLQTQTFEVDKDVFQAPASPVAVLDGDHSVICSDSPLPLAERLRLKCMK